MTAHPIADTSAPAGQMQPSSAHDLGMSGRHSVALLRRFKASLGPGRPDPWLNRKFAVGYVDALAPSSRCLYHSLSYRILLALSVWSFYVMVGRVCVPVFQGVSSAFSVASAGEPTALQARRAMECARSSLSGGVLAGYLVLFLLYAWSYARMLFTGPGFAKEVGFSGSSSAFRGGLS